MTIGITMATYQRPDGGTPKFLKRAIRSVAEQTYQDFVLYVVGDKYKDNDEFIRLMKEAIEEHPNLEGKLVYENRPHAPEREKYLESNKVVLWNCGGTSALNYAVFLACQDMNTKTCHLDHDDFWDIYHLETIVKAINDLGHPPFMHTLSSYVGHPYFPQVNPDGGYQKITPACGNLIHSSVYIDFEQIPFTYRDVFQSTGNIYPSDGDLWNRISEHTIANSQSCFLIKTRTCYHDLENH